MENSGTHMTVYYLNENNKSEKQSLEIEAGNTTPGQVESILTRGLQFYCRTEYKSTVIPPHRITKITY